MAENSGAHFNDIAQSYEKAAKSWQCIYTQAQHFIDPLICGKTVLDIGNGGIFSYDSNLAKRVFVVDVSSEMLKRINNPEIGVAVANALDLAPIKDCSVDVVLYVLCMHHINGRTFPETMQMLDRILATAYRVLKPGGGMIVVEPVLRGAPYAIEKICYGLMRFLLATRRVPMVFFYCKNILRKAIARQFMLPEKMVEAHALKLEGFIDPLGGTLPGIIKIPVQLYPATFTLFQVVKA